MRILLLFYCNYTECLISVSNANEKERCVVILSGYIMKSLVPSSTADLFTTLQSEKTKQLFLC